MVKDTSNESGDARRQFGEATSSQNKPIILVLPDVAYPCTEGITEEILARRLPCQGFRVEWVMRTVCQSSRNQVSWYGSNANLIRTKFRKGLQWLGILRQILAGLSMTKKCHPQIWFVRNSIPLAFIGLYARWRFGCNLVYHVSFPFPEVYTQLSKQDRPSGWLLKLLGWKLAWLVRNFTIKRYDLVLPISPLMADDYRKFGTPQNILFTLPMGGVIEDLPALETQVAIRNGIGIGTRPMILYFGAIHQLREIEILIKAIPVTLQRLKDAVLVLLGPMKPEYRAELEEIAWNSSIENHIKFVSPVLREKVREWIAAANVTVSPIPLNDYYIVSSPTKAVESLACGTPVVGTRIPDQQELIEKSGGGVCVDFTPDGLAEGICSILSDPQKAMQMGKTGREYIKKYRSYDVLASGLAKKLKELLD